MGVSFSSKLLRPDVPGAWTFAFVPKAAAVKAGFRARMRVKGTIDGTPFRSSLIPRGRGVLFVVVNHELRERIRKSAGDTVRLDLEVDTSPVEVPIPPALQRALAHDSKASGAFHRFTPSQRLAYARWIAGAKQEATRDRRVATTIEKLRRGEKLN